MEAENNKLCATDSEKSWLKRLVSMFIPRSVLHAGDSDSDVDQEEPHADPSRRMIVQYAYDEAYDVKKQAEVVKACLNNLYFEAEAPFEIGDSLAVANAKYVVDHAVMHMHTTVLQAQLALLRTRGNRRVDLRFGLAQFSACDANIIESKFPNEGGDFEINNAEDTSFSLGTMEEQSSGSSATDTGDFDYVVPMGDVPKSVVKERYLSKVSVGLNQRQFVRMAASQTKCIMPDVYVTLTFRVSRRNRPVSDFISCSVHLPHLYNIAGSDTPCVTVFEADPIFSSRLAADDDVKITVARAQGEEHAHEEDEMRISYEPMTNSSVVTFAMKDQIAQNEVRLGVCKDIFCLSLLLDVSLTFVICDPPAAPGEANAVRV